MADWRVRGPTEASSSAMDAADSGWPSASAAFDGVASVLGSSEPFARFILERIESRDRSAPLPTDIAGHDAMGGRHRAKGVSTIRGGGALRWRLA